MSTESGALNQTLYSQGFTAKAAPGTNPTELIAAAHAGSFSLAVCSELGLPASFVGNILIVATVTVENIAAGWTIKNIHLDINAKLPKVTQGEFIDATVRAKTSCLMSRLLRANVSMHAKLEK
jgi:osmotically inducible protein OsmC